ncbi:hypothetical protein [Rosistilla oblonga]|nr:hypothetical protein [Rosistilla oblonga]
MQFNEEMLTAYLDDELSSDERAIVQQTIDAEPSCAKLLEELREVRDAVAQLPPIYPSADPVAAVRQRIAAQSEVALAREQRAQTWSRLALLATAACLMLAIGSYLLRPELAPESQPTAGSIADSKPPSDPQVVDAPAADSVELRESLAYESSPLPEIQSDVYSSQADVQAVPMMKAQPPAAPFADNTVRQNRRAPQAPTRSNGQSYSRATPSLRPADSADQANRMGGGMGGSMANRSRAAVQSPTRYFFRAAESDKEDSLPLAGAPRLEDLGRGGAALESVEPAPSQQAARGAKRAMAAESEDVDRAAAPELALDDRGGLPLLEAGSAEPPRDVRRIRIQSSPDLLAVQLAQIRDLLAAEKIVSQQRQPAAGEDAGRKDVMEGYAPLRDLAKTANQPIQLVVSGSSETLQRLAEQILKTIANRATMDAPGPVSGSPEEGAVSVLQIDILP